MIFTIIDDYENLQETNFYQFYHSIESDLTSNSNSNSNSKLLSKRQLLSDDEVLRNFKNQNSDLITDSTVSVLMYNSLNGETTQVYSKYKGWLK